MSLAPLNATSKLAERVTDGEVVFFVGSGFSIDSEGNDAKRLVGRLLAGLLGLGATLAELDPGGHQEASRLLDGLGRVFELDGAKKPGDATSKPAQCMTLENLRSLAREYYTFNDWSVSALGALSGEVMRLGAANGKPAPERAELQTRVLARAVELGNFLLRLVGDTEPFDALERGVLGSFASPAARGKALFLDLMGFAKPAIMAGSPRDADLERVAWSYGGRLRPRHHALARLAREGLAPALVTTNYDLLLEGAYRLAGFVERRPDDAAEQDDSARFSRIAGAQHFFARGAGYRTALLLKIHGCVEAYREARHMRLDALKKDAAVALNGGFDSWSAYLPSLVFTYREIQTWRGDAWSRDLIRTLLRTHTVALCGYSGADPVMHSTFRDVYEEQASVRPRGAAPAPESRSEPGNAAAFFFGIRDRREFHSLEILRAATVAAGLSEGKLVDHPNNIEFAFAPDFPTLDEHFGWLLHRVVRDLQRQALRTHLRRLLPPLLGRECRDKEIAGVLASFERLCAAEIAVIERISSRDPALALSERRREFERIVGWSWHFLAGLMRELALADGADARRATGVAFRRPRSAHHYQPIAEHPEWAAWAAVVELGVRALIGRLDTPETGVAAEASCYAAVSFSPNRKERTPVVLCIRFGAFERPGRAPAVTGAFRRISFWEFGERDVPWPRDAGPCPNAALVWSWASGNPGPTSAAAREFLGLT
jgi:hypothetical protein